MNWTDDEELLKMMLGQQEQAPPFQVAPPNVPEAPQAPVAPQAPPPPSPPAQGQSHIQRIPHTKMNLPPELNPPSMNFFFPKTPDEEPPQIMGLDERYALYQKIRAKQAEGNPDLQKIRDAAARKRAVIQMMGAAAQGLTAKDAARSGIKHDNAPYDKIANQQMEPYSVAAKAAAKKSSDDSAALKSMMGYQANQENIAQQGYQSRMRDKMKHPLEMAKIGAQVGGQIYMNNERIGADKDKQYSDQQFKSGEWKLDRESREKIAAAKKEKMAKMTDEQKFNATIKIKNHVKGNKQYELWQKTVRQGQQILNKLAQPGPFSDVGVLFDYMKLLDPGSVVRESEAKMFMQAAGLFDGVQMMIKKGFDGEGFLLDHHRDELARLVRAAIEIDRGGTERSFEQDRAMVQDFELDARHVFPNVYNVDQEYAHYGMYAEQREQEKTGKSGGLIDPSRPYAPIQGFDPNQYLNGNGG